MKLKDYRAHLGELVRERTGQLESLIADMHLTLEKVQESETLFRKLFEDHTAAKLIIDPDGGSIIDANDAAADFYGWPKERLRRMNIQEISVGSPGERELAIEMARPITRVHSEFQHRRADGSIRDVEVLSGIIEVEGKELLHSIVYDITERKQAEQELLQAKRDWEATFDAMTDLAAILDIDYRIVRANKAMADRLGRTTQECAGLKCYQVVHGMDEPPQFCPHRLLLADRTEHTAEAFEENLGGYFSVRVSPLFDPSGEFKGSVHVCRDITERKQAENELKQSEGKYRQLFEVESDALLLVEVDSLKILDANSAALTLYGYNRDELLRMLGPDLSGEPEQTIHAITGEIGRVSERWHRKKDGTIFPVEISAAYFVLDGKRLHIAAVRDISDRKQMEQSLKESEQRWQFALNGPGDGVWDWNVRTKRVFYSTRWKTMLGYEENEIGAAFDEWEKIVHSDDRQRCYADMDCHFRGETPFYQNEHRLLCKDGSYKWILARGKVVEWAEAGKPLRVIGTHTDITERRRSEEVLRNNEAQLRQIIDLLPHIVFVKDWDGKYLLVNKALADANNMSVGELTGKYHRDIHSNKSEVRKMLWDDREVMMKGMMKFIPEEPYTDVLGNLRFHQATKVPFHMLEGKMPAVLGIAVDITDKKLAGEEKEKLQAQLMQAQKMESVGRLAGGVAHDFNNMLGVILGYTEMALGKVDCIHPLFADLQEIRKAATRSADLTRQLLAFARKQTALPKVLDLNDTVEGMLKMLRRVIGEDIELAWMPGNDLWPVRVDPTQMDQILANLCVNSRDAISGTGKVTIETRNVVYDRPYSEVRPWMAAGEYVMLTVSDDGCGMDKETVGKIFEPFFTTKEVGKGTGLGLSTVYGIVKQNGGFIDVYSEPGKGTTFKIYLPQHGGRKPEGLDTGYVKTAKGHGETVLLVEDEEVMLNMTRLMLERQGYRVIAASSPDTAMRLAHEHKGEIRLLKTDVVMPGMNGRDMANKLLSLVPNVKCLFMSGYTADVIAREGVLDDGVNFIEKPFSMKDMVAKVREALGQE